MVRLVTVCLILLSACSWEGVILLRNTTSLPVTVTYRVDTLVPNRLSMEVVEVYERNSDQLRTYLPDISSTVTYTLAPGEEVAFARVYHASFDSLSVPCRAGYAEGVSPCMPVDTFHFTTAGTTYSVVTSRLDSLIAASDQDLGAFIALLEQPQLTSATPYRPDR